MNIFDISISVKLQHIYRGEISSLGLQYIYLSTAVMLF